MARQVEGPWFRSAKDTLYATLGGKKVNLRVRGENNRAAATKAWHRLMADGPAEQEPKPSVSRLPPAPAPKPTVTTVRQLADTYLADAAGRIAPHSLRGYKLYLRVLVDGVGRLSAVGIDPDAVEALSRRPDWSPTYRANFLAHVGMMYRWGVRRRMIPSNPVAGLRKPQRQSRGSSAVVSEEEHRALMQHAKPETGELLSVLWATGCRPGEAFGLTAEMVNASRDGVIPLKDHKTAHQGKARFLILSGAVWKVVRRRAKVVGSGFLWKSETGGKLATQAFGHRLKKLCKRAGVRHLMPYGYRHGYATEALSRGVPDATVAALLGHGSTAMLHRHYSHLTSRADVLREAARRVRG